MTKASKFRIVVSVRKEKGGCADVGQYPIQLSSTVVLEVWDTALLTDAIAVTLKGVAGREFDANEAQADWPRLMMQEREDVCLDSLSLLFSTTMMVFVIEYLPNNLP